MSDTAAIRIYVKDINREEWDLMTVKERKALLIKSLKDALDVSQEQRTYNIRATNNRKVGHVAISPAFVESLYKG